MENGNGKWKCILLSDHSVRLPGSASFVFPEAHICWLGHPAHPEVLPASSLCVPGQSVETETVNSASVMEFTRVQNSETLLLRISSYLTFWRVRWNVHDIFLRFQTRNNTCVLPFPKISAKTSISVSLFRRSAERVNLVKTTTTVQNEIRKSSNTVIANNFRTLSIS